VNAEDVGNYIRDLGYIRKDLIADLNRGNHSMLGNAAEDLLKDTGVDGINKDSQDYKKLNVEIHKAAIKLMELERKHRNGDFLNKDDLPTLFPEIFSRINLQPRTDKTSETIKQATDS
jgi:hypothetical protein